MSVRIVWPGTYYEVRTLPVPWYVPGGVVTIALELYSPDGHGGPTLAASAAGQLQASLDGGIIYTPLGTDLPGGLALGDFTAGERKSLKLQPTITPGTVFRYRAIELSIGLGI